MKKILCILLIVCLLMVCAAESSNVGTLYNAARKLGFDTHNVTLTAEAEFRFDGEWFKTMHASYKQDGVRSLLSYMLDTPKPDGSVYTGGYTVLGLGSECYYNNTRQGNYYNTTPTYVRDTVIRSDNRTEVLLDLGEGLALLAEGLLDVNEKNGNTYTFRVDGLNDMVDTAIYYLVGDYVQDRYYRDVFGQYDGMYPSVGVSYENWSACVQNFYTALFGEAEVSDDLRAEREYVIYNLLEQKESELRMAPEGGWAFVKNDGSVVWYDNEIECMQQNGQMYVEYADYFAAARFYHENRYGETLTDDELSGIYMTTNMDVWNEWLTFAADMEAFYISAAREKNDKAVSCIVGKDGSVSAYAYPINSSVTLTQTILSTMRFARLSRLEAAVTTDDEGRLTAFSGTVDIEITDKYGDSHIVSVSFECTAGDYGKTSVPSVFNPGEFGWVSVEEYTEQEAIDNGGPEPIDEEIVLPEKITFLGKEYDMTYDQ